jgi:hypothetical protein
LVSRFLSPDQGKREQHPGYLLHICNFFVLSRHEDNIDGTLFNIFFSIRLRQATTFPIKKLLLQLFSELLPSPCISFLHFCDNRDFVARLTVVIVLVQYRLNCGDNKEFTFSNIDL